MIYLGKLEILAPAGGTDSVLPAVRAGADAIYLGASSFSARASAHNFSREQLAETVRLCHLNGVAVHLACNILVHDDEIDDALSLIEFACNTGVDALIMQDTGLISLVRSFAPEMPVHGSTQLSVHTRAGVENLWKMGLTRVVLSRELSAAEIEEIARDCPVELEVFVHGALCMSVSGQCYFSAMLGSRSGNRGACAQPCRLPFSVKGGTGHDLSLKDLSIIEHLRELEQMGIASAKIEGRMKRPEYVAAAVAACRQSLDSGTVSAELYDKLEAVFSRSGFTEGYYSGKRGLSMFGIRSKENVQAADSKMLASIHELYKKERQHIPVDFSLKVQQGKPSVLTARDGDGFFSSAEGAAPEKAIKLPLDKERAEKSISKTGGTPFIMNSLSAEIEEGLMLPASALNLMRTQCLDILSSERSELRSVPFTSLEREPVVSRGRSLPSNYRARFPDGNIPDDFLDSELIYVPLTIASSQIDDLLDRGFAVAVEIPRGMFGLEKKIIRELERVRELGINEVLAGNVGAVEIARRLDMDVHGGFGLNISNTESLLWAERQGMLDTEVSFELTLEQITRLGGKIPIGIISMGRLPLMLTRNCPAQNDGRGCKRCDTAPTIRDRKGITFPMQCFGACTEILNSVPLIMSDRYHELKGISFEVLRFSTETPEQRLQMLEMYRNHTVPKTVYTRGLYYRGTE